MFGFKALNTQPYSNVNSSDEEDDGYNTVELSVEARETKNMQIYNQAMGFLKNNDYLQAQQSFHELLNSPLLSSINPNSKTSVLLSPMAMLKYSTLKNMADLYDKLGKRDLSLKMYIEAIDLDQREVYVWYQIGRLAMSLGKWNIARVALEKSVQLSSNSGQKQHQTHWLSLEKLIELLYVLGDHDTVEQIIQNKILLLEPGHLKANLIRLLIERNKFQALVDSNTPLSSQEQQIYSQKLESLKQLIGNNESTKSYIQSLQNKFDSLKSPSTNNSATNENSNESSPMVSEYQCSSTDYNQLILFFKTIYKSRSNQSKDLYKPLSIDYIGQINDNFMEMDDHNIIDSNNNSDVDIIDLDNDKQVTMDVDQPHIENDRVMDDTSLRSSQESIEYITPPIDRDAPRPQSPPLHFSNSSVTDPNTTPSNTEVITSPDTQSVTSTSTTTVAVNLPTRSRRIETRAKVSAPVTNNSKATRSSKQAVAVLPQPDDLVELDEYLEALINKNRPVSQIVLDEFQSNRSLDTSTISGNDDDEGKPSNQNNQHNQHYNQHNNQESKSISEFFKNIRDRNQIVSINILDWIIQFLDFVTSHCTFTLSTKTLTKLQSLCNIVRSHADFYYNYYLLFSELLFDRYLLNIEKESLNGKNKATTSDDSANGNKSNKNSRGKEGEQQEPSQKKKKTKKFLNGEFLKNNDELASLSYFLQQLTLNLCKFPRNDLKFKIRYKWLLARYTRKVLGDINLATIYYGETDELLKEIQTTEKVNYIIVYNCKFDNVINELILEELISNLQDQQKKNTVGQLFNSKRFDQVISLLEPIFPDSLVCLDIYIPPSSIALSPNGSNSGNKKSNTTQSKQQQIINQHLNNFSIFGYQFEVAGNRLDDSLTSQQKSRLNMIDLLLQSYLNISNHIGVLKMTIVLLKEISIYQFNSETFQKYYLLIKMIFSHENMKPRALEEPLTTLLSVLVRVILQFYRKNVSFQLFSLFLDIYQFDESKKLNLSELMSLYFILHSDLGKKKLCHNELPFLYKFIEILFQFLTCSDQNQVDSFQIEKYIEPKEDMLAANIINDIAQCFDCLYGIRLCKTVDDHHCKLSTKKDELSPKQLMQLFIIKKWLSNELEDIPSIPINPRLNSQESMSILIDISDGNKRDIKDLIEKIYLKFKEPPVFITSKYKDMINNYFKGILSEIPLKDYDDEENANGTLLSPQQLEILFKPPVVFQNLDKSNQVPLDIDVSSDKILKDNVIFNDIYKDIYNLHVNYLETQKSQSLMIREILLKDLYCNPNRIYVSNPDRIGTWNLLSNSYAEEYSNLTEQSGILVNDQPEIEQKIDQIFQKLRLTYKHLSRLDPLDEATHTSLAEICYQKHYFISTANIKNYKSQSEKLYYETLVHLESAIKIDSDNWYYYYLKGKTERKLGKSPKTYFETLYKAIQLINTIINPKNKNQPIYPIYRLHCDRLKLLIQDPSNLNSSVNNIFPLNDHNLTFLEKFNFQKKDNTTTTINQPQQIQPQPMYDVDMEDNVVESNTIPITTQPVLTIEQRIENLIENSIEAFQYCRSLLSYHHQSAYRLSWIIKMNQRKEPDASSNTLAEFNKLLKPKLLRLSKSCVWGLWHSNLEHVCEGKMDRYFLKYYKFLNILLEENNDIKSLEILYYRLKNDLKFSKLSSASYLSCCKVLSNLIHQKTNQKHDIVHSLAQDQNLNTIPNNSNIINNNNNNEDNLQQQPITNTAAQSNINVEIDGLLKYIWDLYSDIYLHPEHKSTITNLMTESFNLLAHTSPKKKPTWDDVLGGFEKKFAKTDNKRKKKAMDDSTNDSNTTNTNINLTSSPTFQSNLIINLNSNNQVIQPLKKLKLDVDPVSNINNNSIK